MDKAQALSIKGVFTELMTPFKDDGQIDFGMLEKEVDFQVENGIHGLFTNGLASEAIMLDADELIETTKIVVDTAKHRLPVIGNIACQNMRDAFKVLKGYEEAGVDAICMMQPCVYAISQKNLVDYFSQIASASSLPVGFYNAPQTGNTLSPASVAQLFNEHDNMKFYKESTIDFVHIQTTMRLISPDKEYAFMNGSDATTFSVLQLGGAGIVSLISAIFPKPVMAITEAWENGDLESARKAQNYVLKIREALKIGPFDAGYKYAGSLIGLSLGRMRAPLGELTASEKERIKNNLLELGLIN